MTDAHGRKHHSLQIKEKPSKAGSFTGLLLKLFNWNGWLLRKGVPKKLPPAERSQDSKNCNEDERLPMPTLLLIPNEKSASSATLSRTDNPYGAVKTIPAEDDIHLRKPGVVARLMGLDYIPCSPSQKGNTDAHQQAIPAAPTGKRQYFKSKEADLAAKTFDNSSKKVNVNKQLQQRQIARSLDINLQKISKTSFLNYASKPVCQKEDIQKMLISKEVSSHRSRSNSPPSKSTSKLRSTQKNTESKRATLLLEAAVKTLEPNFQSGDQHRPVLVQALASRTANPKVSGKRINLERRDDGRNFHNDNIGVSRKGSAISSTANLPSQTKFCCSQEERGAWQVSPVASHQESQKLKTSAIQARNYCSDQHQLYKMGVEGVTGKGHHHGQVQFGTSENISRSKPKIVKEVFATSQQPDKKFVHNELEEATTKTNDRLHGTGRRKTPMLTAKGPTNSSKSEKLNTKQYPLKHEDDELSARLIKPSAESNVETEPKMTEISHTEKMSTASKNSRPGKDRRFGQIHKEVLTWNGEETDIKGGSQASQEKTLTTRRALVDFSIQRNQNDSNTKHKSLSNTSAGKSLQKSRDSKSSFRGTEELGVTLASCTEKSKSHKYSQTAENQELVLDIDGPHLPTESEKSAKEYAGNETTKRDVPENASYGVQCADDDSLNNVDILPLDRKYLLVSRHCDALFLEKTKEQSLLKSQISKTEIEIRTQDKLCAEHPGDELPNEKDAGDCALKDDDLEEILKGMLSMTIASDSSNEKDYKKDIGFLSEDCSKACNHKLEGQCQPPLHEEEPRATSITLEIRSPPPPESTVSTPRCVENVAKIDTVEESGQPSPVSVLELPFEDEYVCSWNGEALTEKVMDALHSRPELAPRGNTTSQSTCNTNLLATSKGCNREMIQEAILYNLKQHFLDLLRCEATDCNHMDCIQVEVGDAKATNLLMLQACENTSWSDKIRRVQCQQLHRFATTENTCASEQEYSSRRSEASDFHDKLLSDCAKEALSHKLSSFRHDDLWCQPSYVELTATGRRIVHEACKQILVWSQLNLSTINDLVDRDLSLPAGNWTDSQKADEIGAQIESAIFDAILEELVYDLSNYGLAELCIPL